MTASLSPAGDQIRCSRMRDGMTQNEWTREDVAPPQEGEAGAARGDGGTGRRTWNDDDNEGRRFD